MRKMKWATALVAAIFLANSVAFAADLPDEQFTPSNPPTGDRYTGISFAVGEDDKNSMSALEAFTADGTDRSSKMLTRTVCKRIGDPGCESSKFFQYSSQLTFCNAKVSSDCVKSVFARDASGNVSEGKFVEEYPGETKYSYAGDPSVDLPPGTSSFIVDFPNLAHKGGTKYLVIVSLLGSRGFNEEKFKLESFTTAIYAVSKITGNFNINQPEDIVRSDFTLSGRQRKGGGWTSDETGPKKSSCVQAATGTCLIPWQLPLDVEFGLNLKLNTKVTGWLHGRLADAKAEISILSDGDQQIILSGKPSTVPGLSAWFKKDSLPTPLKNHYRNDDRVDSNGAGWPSTVRDSRGQVAGNGPDGLPFSILKTAFGYDEGGIREFRAWIDSVGDKATYAPTIWTARTIQSGPQFGECMKGQEALSGIVTTNSTMYVGAPPTFNKNEGTLDYKVSSPHYLPDGTEFKGMYNLIIKSDVARCIYGFTAAPVSATISIISSDGTNQVATTLFGERDGWMYLKANNFTFSTPILKVKLTQEADKPVVSATPTPTAKPVSTKKTSITCLKGKSKKKVTAVKPVCPKGFKRK